MTGKAQFFKADVAFRFFGAKQISSWINKVVKKESAQLGALNIIFCSDAYLLNINKQFLKHDFYTDIITFDNSGEGGVSGELYISIDRVRENALALRATFRQELNRVIIHGVLHLLGYKDKTPSQIKKIRKKEDAYLRLLR
jgi:probable rRNA maturation factor